jgi:hypothetical protein
MGKSKDELMGKGAIAVVLWLACLLLVSLRVSGAVTGIVVVVLALGLLIAAVAATINAFSRRQPASPVEDADEEVDYAASKYEELARFEEEHRRRDG